MQMRSCLKMIHISLFFFCQNAFSDISESAFMDLMRAHQKRIRVAAEFMIKKRPDIFGGLQSAVVTEYLSLHDSPKTMDLPSLAKYGYNNKQTIGARLAVFFGKNIEKLPASERAELSSIINDLNSIEDKMKAELLPKLRLTSKQSEQLKLLERVADVTDTGFARAKEMGIAADMLNGSKYLASKGETLAATLSRELSEALYKRGFITSLSTAAKAASTVGKVVKTAGAVTSIVSVYFAHKEGQMVEQEMGLNYWEGFFDGLINPIPYYETQRTVGTGLRALGKHPSAEGSLLSQMVQREEDTARRKQALQIKEQENRDAWVEYFNQLDAQTQPEQ